MVDSTEFLCIGDEVALLLVSEDPIGQPNVGYMCVQMGKDTVRLACRALPHVAPGSAAAQTS